MERLGKFSKQGVNWGLQKMTWLQQAPGATILFFLWFSKMDRRSFSGTSNGVTLLPPPV